MSNSKTKKYRVETTTILNEEWSVYAASMEEAELMVIDEVDGVELEGKDWMETEVHNVFELDENSDGDTGAVSNG